MKRMLYLYPLILVAGVMWGCGSESDGLPPRAPVSGTVTLDGEPLAFAMVTFHPDGEGNPGNASTREDGSYTVSTYHSQDGAIIGKHVVTVVRDLPPQMRRTASDSASIPKTYVSKKTSPLKYEVADSSNMIDIELSSKPESGN